jgi:hypothetical protein
MKKILALSILLSLSACFKQKSEISITETLYHGGDILTMKGDNPAYVESMVIVGDSIAFFGKSKRG